MKCEQCNKPYLKDWHKLDLVYLLFSSDYLHVYDGYVPQAAKIEALTGTAVPNSINSTSSSVLMILVTDHITVGAGFKIRYESGTSEYYCVARSSF